MELSTVIKTRSLYIGKPVVHTVLFASQAMMFSQLNYKLWSQEFISIYRFIKVAKL